MLNFYLAWSIGYPILLWLLGRTWKVPTPTIYTRGNSFKVSLLIPFRNEIEKLPALVVEIQKLRSSVFEIILVDDYSEDGSNDFLVAHFNSVSEVKILKNQSFGKKGALSLGVSFAEGEIILCTDADCKFTETWVEAICSPFQAAAVQLVAGPVISANSNLFFSDFQQIEWASILVVTNYSFSRNKPLMCSAANFAYRKSAFEAVDGYKGNLHQLSGDDEFLLKKIMKKFSNSSAIYLINQEALVITESQDNWLLLIQQRIRWASKWRAHGSATHTSFTLISFMVQLVWVASFGLLFLGIPSISSFLIVWLGKSLAEYLTLSRPLKTYCIDQNPINFISTSLIHPFFVLVVGFAALRGKFSWKGRSNVRSVILANKFTK
jgi:glycosyltransferase involved in cell wall biosynthesis